MASYDLDAMQTLLEALADLADGDVINSTVNAIAEKIGGSGAGPKYQVRIYTAAKYGLIETNYDTFTRKGTLKILALGRKLLSPLSAPEAKAIAFLMVPLHREIYRRFRGQPLPLGKDLERVMIEELGVTAGQAPNGRQILIRAAAQAGYFSQSADRLTIPEGVELPACLREFLETPMVQMQERKETLEANEILKGSQVTSENTAKGLTTIPEIDPAVTAWLTKIPNANSTWPKAKRDRWLTMLGQLLDYVFDDDHEQPSMS